MNKFSLVSTLRPCEVNSSVHTRQCNALFSWAQLPSTEVLIVGADDETAVKSAERFNFRCNQDVLRAYDIGYFSLAPITRAVVQSALEMTTAPWIILINSDIILLPSFEEKLDEVINKIPSEVVDSTFITIRRRDYEGQRLIGSVNDLWELEYRIPSRLHPVTGSDVFVASRYYWETLVPQMPSFIHGKFSWDVYLHHYAVTQSKMAIDASNTVHCFHSFHGSLVDSNNPEIYHNLMLYEALFGGEIFTLNDPRWVSI